MGLHKPHPCTLAVGYYRTPRDSGGGGEGERERNREKGGSQRDRERWVGSEIERVGGVRETERERGPGEGGGVIETGTQRETLNSPFIFYIILVTRYKLGNTLTPALISAPPATATAA